MNHLFVLSAKDIKNIFIEKNIDHVCHECDNGGILIGIKQKRSYQWIEFYHIDSRLKTAYSFNPKNNEYNFNLKTRDCIYSNFQTLINK